MRDRDRLAVDSTMLVGAEEILADRPHGDIGIVMQMLRWHAMAGPAPTGNDEKARNGGPVDAALFSRVEQLIQRARLIQDERIAVPTGSAASEVHVARKEFEMGHVDQSLRAVVRVSASFDQMVAQWENLARNKERQKRGMSMQQIRKMHAEHTGVRTRIQLVQAQLRRLRSGLDHLERTSGRQVVESEQAELQEGAAASTVASSGETTQGPCQLPPGFLEALKAARRSRDRSEVVQQYFDVETTLGVEIRRERGRDRAIFSPCSVPPVNRFYFLLDTAEIIRIRRAKITDVVHVHYPDTRKRGRMSLKDFVKHVRKGVWLLRPKSPGGQGETASS